MRLVIDTNVVFSALYNPDSVPGDILRLAVHEVLRLLAPDSVRDELTRTLTTKLGYADDESNEVLATLPIEWMPAVSYEGALDMARQAIHDRDDAPVVAAALVAGCPVVTGDRAFHPLRKRVVKTLRPADVLEHMREETGDPTRR